MIRNRTLTRSTVLAVLVAVVLLVLVGAWAKSPPEELGTFQESTGTQNFNSEASEDSLSFQVKQKSTACATMAQNGHSKQLMGGWRAVDVTTAKEEWTESQSLLEERFGTADVEVVAAEQQVVAGLNRRMTVKHPDSGERWVVSYYLPLQGDATSIRFEQCE